MQELLRTALEARTALRPDVPDAQPSSSSTGPDQQSRQPQREPVPWFVKAAGEYVALSLFFYRYHDMAIRV